MGAFLKGDPQSVVCDSGVGLRVLVTGGRDYSSARRVFFVLDELHRGTPVGIVATGSCPFGGADGLAETWAKRREVWYRGYPAPFGSRGKRGGPERNQAMLDDFNPDVVIAFPGGRGTSDMVRRAQLRSVRVVMVDG